MIVVPTIQEIKRLEFLSNQVPIKNISSKLVARNVISTTTRMNRQNRIASPIELLSNPSITLSSALPLPAPAMQGIVRLIVHDDSIEIYHSRVNETFPKKEIVTDNLAIANKLEFIKSNEEYMGKINEIVDMASKIFSSSPLNRTAVLDYMVLAFLNNDRNYGLAEAIEYGDGFIFPPEVHTMHAKRFEELDHNLEKLIEEIQAINKPNRFNMDRVTEWMIFDPDGPDNHRLLAMVLGGGVILHPAKDFVINWKHGLPSLSLQYLQARAPVN